MAVQNTGLRIVAGFDAVFFGARDASGNLIGNTSTPPANGNADGSSMYRIPGGVELNVALPEAEAVPAPGDNTVLTNFIFAPDTLPDGTLVTASRDALFEAIAQGTKVYNYASATGSIGLTGKPAYQQMIIHGIRQAQSADIATFGTKKFQNFIYPNVQVQPLLNEFNTRQHSPFNYRLVVNQSGQWGTGETFTNSKHGTTLSGLYIIDSDNPMHMTTYRGNNTLTTFNLPFTPISASKTLAFVAGVPVSVSSVDTTLKTFTLGSAPGTGAILTVFYEFEESDL